MRAFRLKFLVSWVQHFFGLPEVPLELVHLTWGELAKRKGQEFIVKKPVYLQSLNLLGGAPMPGCEGEEIVSGKLLVDDLYSENGAVIVGWIFRHSALEKEISIYRFKSCFYPTPGQLTLYTEKVSA